MQGHTFQRARHTTAAWTVLLVGIALSCVAYYVVGQSIEREARLRFESAAADVHYAVEAQLRSYIQVLIGLQALFNAEQDVTRADFARYVDSLQLKKGYSGFQNLNFARYVRREDKPVFEEKLRNDKSLSSAGLSNNGIRPPGDRKDYYVVEYTEPMIQGNFSAIGIDIAADPIRRILLDYETDTGESSSSGVPVARSKDLNTPVVGIRAPVYRVGMPTDTVAQRRAAIIGSVGAALRVSDLLHEALNPRTLQRLRVRVHTRVGGRPPGRLTARPLDLV